MLGFKSSDVKTIMSISRKLDLDKGKLQTFLKGQKLGIPENKLLADLLGASEGENPEKFLAEQLSPDELGVLRTVVTNMAKNEKNNH